MRICRDHWAKCRAAVEARGMSHLVQDGRHHFEKSVAELEGEGPAPTDFDPLMAMNNNFLVRALDLGGIGVLGHNPNDPEGEGHYCPLCLPKKSFEHHNTPTGRCPDPKCRLQVKPGEKPWDQQWIDSCADDMLNHCVKVGLIKMAS